MSVRTYRQQHSVAAEGSKDGNADDNIGCGGLICDAAADSALSEGRWLAKASCSSVCGIDGVTYCRRMKARAHDIGDDGSLGIELGRVVIKPQLHEPVVHCLF